MRFVFVFSFRHKILPGSGLSRGVFNSGFECHAKSAIIQYHSSSLFNLKKKRAFFRLTDLIVYDA